MAEIVPIEPRRRKPQRVRLHEMYSEEAVARERECILGTLPSDRDMTDAEMENLLKSQNKYVVADLLALSKCAPDPKTREWALKECLNRGFGRPEVRKRTDADEVGVVLIEKGTYGIK